MKKYAMIVVILLAVAGVVVGRMQTTQTPVASSSFGPMALYKSAEQPFLTEYPAEWVEHPDIQKGSISVWRTGSQEEWFVIVEGSTVHGESLNAYVDSVILTDKQTDPQYELVSREQIETVQGLSVELLEYTLYDGAHSVSALIYLHNNETGFRAAYGAPTTRYEEMKDMIAYSFSTFHVN